MHRAVVKNMDVIIVHTSKEVDIYSNFFKVSKSRFQFIPYFAYKDALEYSVIASNDKDSKSYILAIGRHRDFDCFIRALRKTNFHGIIIAGNSDRHEIVEQLPPNIELIFEVPFERYIEIISQMLRLWLFHCMRIAIFGRWGI